jgi:hypothetical protein
MRLSGLLHGKCSNFRSVAGKLSIDVAEQLDRRLIPIALSPVCDGALHFCAKAASKRAISSDNVTFDSP